jgi:hypothetical protein
VLYVIAIKKGIFKKRNVGRKILALKEKADKILQEIGLPLKDALKLYDW